MTVDNPNPSTSPELLTTQSQAILDLITKQQQMDKVQALLKLLEIEDKKITIAGEQYSVLNLELDTEYPNAKFTKHMIKLETWRGHIRQVLHLRDINDEKLIGYHNAQVMLKMTSHRRKRAQEIVNGLRNEISGTEVIPQRTRTKRFFGMI